MLDLILQRLDEIGRDVASTRDDVADVRERVARLEERTAAPATDAPPRGRRIARDSAMTAAGGAIGAAIAAVIQKLGGG